MENALKYKQQYYDDLQKVLQGTVTRLDTNKLLLPKVENTAE